MIVAIYMAQIDSYAKIGSMEQVRVYGIIVNGLCKSGRLRKPWNNLSFRGNGVVMANDMFYSSLIDSLGKAVRVNEAERLFEEMIVEGMPTGFVSLQ